MKWAAVFALLSSIFFPVHGDTYHDRLSAEVSGRHTIRSSHGTYLRAWKGHFDMLDWHVNMAAHRKECEQWYIENRGGKVTMWPFCKPEMYLSAEEDGSSVTLSSTGHLWEPYKFADGSWSFLSAHGRWLTADKNGSVYTVNKIIDSWENFELRSWIGDERAKDASTSASPVVSEESTEDSTSPKPKEEIWVRYSTGGGRNRNDYAGRKNDIGRSAEMAGQHFITTPDPTSKEVQEALSPVSNMSHQRNVATTPSRPAQPTAKELLNVTQNCHDSQASISYFKFAIIVYAFLVFILVVFVKLYLVSHKPKPEITLSCQNLVYEDLHP